MDYAPLVRAIQEGDQEAANRLVAKAGPILIRMLKVRMNATREDAEDAVQTMFYSVITAIQEGRIRNPSGLLSYMIVTCKHNYLKNREQFRTELDEKQVNDSATEPDQLTRLIDREREEALSECLESLPPEQKEFIGYWLSHPDARASEVAERFGITVNNAWTRKHRIIRALQRCLKSKQ